MFENTIKSTVVPLLLRIGLAVIFIYHGLQLVSKGMGTSWAPAEMMPMPLQLLVAWGQLLGGIAMVLGFLTRLAAVGLIVIMVGAIVTVHWPHGFRLFDPENPDIAAIGYEYNFAIIILCLPLVLTGPGMLAVDHWLRLRMRKK